jgi:mannose-6-phosphate isomerase
LPTTKRIHVLEPFLLERRLVPKVWGGRALQNVLGIQLPAGEAIGEAWELFDRPDGSSRLRGSQVTLRDLVRRDPEAIVGAGVPLGHGRSFPLMLKFLDARDGLSLQVHPDDRGAVRDGDVDGGKNECCLILHVTDDARIVLGTRPGVDREQFLARWQTAEVEQMVHAFRPQVGDLIHIPPGTVHGIGPGVVAFEVQQNSDLTYRFYDWGRGREVHLDRARGAVHVAPAPGGEVGGREPLPDGGVRLITTEHFGVRRYDLTQRAQIATDGRFATVTVVGGAGSLTWRDGDSAREDSAGEDTAGENTTGELAIALGDTVLVPACVASFELEPDGRLDVVVCAPGER